MIFITISLLGVLHLYDARPDDVLAQRTKTVSETNLEMNTIVESDTSDEANTEKNAETNTKINENTTNDGDGRRELLAVPLLHPKGSRVTAVSYYGANGKY